MSRFLAYLGALLAALGSVFLMGRKSGKDTIRAESAESALKDVKRANEIDNEVHALSDDELNRELRGDKRK